MSGSALLFAIAVTSALQLLSFHRLRSSPFFTSQHKTSSSAPTIARPAPEERVAAFCAFSAFSSGAHTAFEEAEVTMPKVFECSYFLGNSVHRRQDASSGANILTSRISPWLLRAALWAIGSCGAQPSFMSAVSAALMIYIVHAPCGR